VTLGSVEHILGLFAQQEMELPNVFLPRKGLQKFCPYWENENSDKALGERHHLNFANQVPCCEVVRLASDEFSLEHLL